MSNIIQKPRYLSELIKDDYKNWKNEKVIFDTPTSSGKTFFILNVLCAYAKENFKKVLYLCNRKKLRKDVQKKVNDLSLITSVKVLSYQKLQNLILDGDPIGNYDYIVFDEIHYLTSDSFNRYTDITYNFLMKQKDNICILMSATAKHFFNTLLKDSKKYKVNKKHYYTIDKDYSYVNKVYFYQADALSTLINGIIEKNPQDKILVFCNSENRIVEMHELYKDNADYYCSDNNKEIKKLCNPDCIKHYDDNFITFDKQILFTTKALDNGVDLKDINIKHIFTEIFDIDSMIQTLGRKRTLNPITDTCSFYIKIYTPQAIGIFKRNIYKELKPVKLLKENEDKFLEIYGYGNKREKELSKIFYTNFKKGNAKNQIQTNGKIYINNMMYLKYSMDNHEIYKMSKLGYIPVVCFWLGSQLSSKVEILDTTIDYRDLFIEYLVSIKGKFLYKEEQQELKVEFKKIGLTARTMGINTLNGYLKDLDYQFIIKNKDDNNNPLRDKRRKFDDGSENPNRDEYYWIVEKIP